MSDKVEKKLSKIQDYVNKPLPEYSSYDTLFDNPDAIKEELIKWNQAKVKASRHYSEAKSIYIYMSEIDDENIDPSERATFEQKVDKYKDKLDHMTDILKSRLFTIDSIIDSTRSLQSHSMSQPDF